MAKYLGKRVILAVLTVLLMACVTFCIAKAVPGNPWGADKVSLQTVIDMIGDLFPISAKVGVSALLWAVLLGMPLGFFAAQSSGNALDSGLRVVCAVGSSMPTFVLAGILLVLLCGGVWTIFPTEFDGSWRCYVLPCFALGFYPMCRIARQSREAMVEASRQPYINAACAKGLSANRIIFKHALRNAVLPVLAALGPLTAFTLCGGFVVEKIFHIPGLGWQFVQSLSDRNYPVMIGVTFFLACLIIAVNLILDILYKLADPR